MKNLLAKQIIPVFFSLLVILCSNGIAADRDIVTITSDKTAVVDRTKGTAVWQKNVYVVRKISGSNLLTDKLTIVRDATSGRIMRAEARGNVKANYFKTEDEEGESLIKPAGEPGRPYTTITCRIMTFNRKAALGVFNGDVDVRSQEFEIQAEHIRYNYEQERGKATARPGGQVAFVIYGKPDPEKDGVRNKTTGVADEILVDRPAGKAVLQGKVHIIDHSDQSQIKSDRAELFFDAQEEIETIIANGRFSMTQPGRFSKADRAVFEYDTEEVTLIGNAYVREDKNNMEISSARIKMYMKVDKGIISGVDDVPVKMKLEIK